MSDYREHNTKTNWAWFDALPGSQWSEDKAREARRHCKRVMRRNRRRAEPAIIRDQLGCCTCKGRVGNCVACDVPVLCDWQWCDGVFGDECGHGMKP